MIPIVAALIGQGLSLIAGAVQAKGQQVIEDKLGIKLNLGDPSTVLELKKLEIQHEEFLAGIAERSDVREVDVFKLEVADKDSARTREVEMAKVNGGPFWWPSTLTVLTFTILIGGGWMLMNVDASELKYAIVALITSVASYYYGTTKASSEQRAVIANALERKQS